MKHVKLKTDESAVDTETVASTLKNVCCREGKKHRGKFEHD